MACWLPGYLAMFGDAGARGRLPEGCRMFQRGSLAAYLSTQEPPRPQPRASACDLSCWREPFSGPTLTRFGCAGGDLVCVLGSDRSRALDDSKRRVGWYNTRRLSKHAKSAGR
jgi:hypothetical protein